MHTPKHFNITDKRAIDDFIQKNAFGQLTSVHDGRLWASHIPFVYDAESGILLAHVAKANPQHASINQQEVMISFSGPHAYVSPQWYEQGGVPTWNYQAVHVYGTAQTFDEPNRLQSVVNRLSEIHEQAQPTPWQPEYPVSMLQAIIGIEIHITEIQCQFKLSQNHPKANRQNVIDQLEQRGQTDLAHAMRESLKGPE